MLILTRKVGESVMVGDDITVTVLGVKGNQVRVGIKAPKDVSVHRKEIYDRIHAVSTDDTGGSISSEGTGSSTGIREEVAIEGEF